MARFRSPIEMPSNAPSVTKLKTKWDLTRLINSSWRFREVEQQGSRDVNSAFEAFEMALHRASYSGDLRQVQSLISGATENTHTPVPMTLLSAQSWGA